MWLIGSKPLPAPVEMITHIRSWREAIPGFHLISGL